MEEERKTEGERPVGWPYFLSGELYGAGLCVMTAEWIIISLSPSLSLFFSANPLPSPVSLRSLLCILQGSSPRPSPFLCKDMQSRTVKFDAREKDERASVQEQKRGSVHEKILLFSKLLPGNVVTNTVPSLPVVYETER